MQAIPHVHHKVMTETFYYDDVHVGISEIKMNGWDHVECQWSLDEQAWELTARRIIHYIQYERRAIKYRRNTWPWPK